MTIEYRVISIGTLAAHSLWGERQERRTARATTTLLTDGTLNILVDPSLPEQILTARLAERANRAPSDITHVFLTSFEPFRRRSLGAFDKAVWLISERERETIGASMVHRLREAHEAGDREMASLLAQEVALLERCQAAEDSLAEGVDLFPLPGVTPGTCGLLLAQPNLTVLICGDAIPTVEHLAQGKVLQSAADVEQARESFAEAVEIADLFILGRDNLAVNPLRRF